MKIKMIPLTALVRSEANVRKTNAATGIEELAASIAAHGLLQNLQVRAVADDKFEVVAGGRRLAALKLLAKRKVMAKDAPIGCNVLDGEDATEISLAENEMRQAMHPADQFDAYKALVDAGQGIEEIAARFGVTSQGVRQRLKLASVSPTLIALYRDEEMTLDHVMAFTVSDYHKAQEAAWFEAPKWERNPQSIRRRLTEAHVKADDRRARFVTVAAYIEAGGSVITDLFQKNEEGYLTDPALLDRLVDEKLLREAETVRQEGWNWVEIMPDADFDALRSFGEAKGKAQPMTAKQEKALAKAEREADKLRELDELTDEQSERLDALDAEIETLSEPVYLWSDRQKAKAGAVVSIGYQGDLSIRRGLIRPEDIKAAKAKDDESIPEAEKEPRQAGLSTALVNDLTAHRTAALRALLPDHPAVALAAIVHALAVPVFYEASGSNSIFALRLDVPCLRAEDIDDSRASKATARQHAAWQGKVPEDEAVLWDWLQAQDSDTLTGLLAYCVASAIKPERSAEADRLATALSLDMAQWWQPTVAGFLGRVSKPQILDAVTEGNGKDAADKLATLKKGEMAERAADLLKGTGWLPAMLKAA